MVGGFMLVMVLAIAAMATCLLRDPTLLRDFASVLG
jgi:hypothetical protein